MEFEQVVDERLRALEVLHSALNGSGFWLNIAQIRSGDVERHCDRSELARLSSGFVALGLSIGKLLRSTAPLARQLREEEHNLNEFDGVADADLEDALLDMFKSQGDVREGSE